MHGQKKNIKTLSSVQDINNFYASLFICPGARYGTLAVLMEIIVKIGVKLRGGGNL